MIRLNVVGLLATFTILANIVNAGNYMWDSSCKPTGKDDDPTLKFLKESFARVLLMSQAGYDGMLPQTGSVSAGVSQALFLLFGATQAGQENVALTVANLVFGTKGVNRLTDEVFSNAALSDASDNNVKFYCDLSRIEPHAEYPNVWVDTDVGASLNEVDVKGFSCDPFIQGDKSLMFTRRFDDVDFYQVQICPFYLNSELPSNAKYSWTTTLLSVKNFVSSVSVNMIRDIVSRGFTEIDAFALFDKVLLHELTHANILRPMEDVLYNRVKAYGWNMAVELAANVVSDSSQTPPVRGPEWNADSWALMGSICYGIQQGTMIGINEDGSLQTSTSVSSESSKLLLRDMLEGMDSRHLLTGITSL